jgi:hypothetical protein
MMVSRAEVEQARKRLGDARLRRASLRQQLSRLAPPPSPRRWPAVLLCCGLVASLSFTLYEYLSAPKSRIERVQRRDMLRSEYEAEKKRIEHGSPFPKIAEGDYPAFTRLAVQFQVNEEHYPAWTQIGMAACTVKRPELARSAYSELDLGREFGGPESDSPDPRLIRAMREVEEHCSAHGIRLKRDPVAPGGK